MSVTANLGMAVGQLSPTCTVWTRRWDLISACEFQKSSSPSMQCGLRSLRSD